MWMCMCVCVLGGCEQVCVEVCMCVRVYVWKRVHVCMQVYMCMCISVWCNWVCIWVCIHMFTCGGVYMSVCMCMCGCKYAYMRGWVCIYVYIYIYRYICIYKCIGYVWVCVCASMYSVGWVCLCMCACVWGLNEGMCGMCLCVEGFVYAWVCVLILWEGNTYKRIWILRFWLPVKSDISLQDPVEGYGIGQAFWKKEVHFTGITWRSLWEGERGREDGQLSLALSENKFLNGLESRQAVWSMYNQWKPWRSQTRALHIRQGFHHRLSTKTSKVSREDSDTGKKMAAIRNKMSTGSNPIPTIAHTHCCVLDIGADSTLQDHLLMKLKEGRGELTQI